MPASKVTWYRQCRPSSLVASFMSLEEKKPASPFDSLGYELVHDYPVYDNGEFFIVDLVEGLEWVVMEWSTFKKLRTVKLDLDAAKKVADDFRDIKLNS